jgi:hypothetical protein
MLFLLWPESDTNIDCLVHRFTKLTWITTKLQSKLMCVFWKNLFGPASSCQWRSKYRLAVNHPVEEELFHHFWGVGVISWRICGLNWGIGLENLSELESQGGALSKYFAEHRHTLQRYVVFWWRRSQHPFGMLCLFPYRSQQQIIGYLQVVLRLHQARSPL